MRHLEESEQNALRSRSLPALELLEVTDHLAECEECRARILAAWDSTRAALSLRQELDKEPEATTPHLTFDEMAGLAAGRLDAVEAEIAMAHAGVCTACQAELDHLRAWSEELAAPKPPPPPRTVHWVRFVVAGLLMVSALVSVVVQFPGSSSHPQEQLAVRDGGSRLALMKDGAIQGVPVLPDEMRALVASALRTGRAGIPEYVPGGRIAPPEAKTFQLVSPVATAIATDRPLFRWVPAGGARAYMVTVFDLSHRKIAGSPLVKQPQWQIPWRLLTGVTYSWQVTAYGDAGEVTAPSAEEPDAEFFILDWKLQQRMQEYRSRWPGFHLLLGLLFARAGLLDDAEAEFRRLADNNPASGLPGALIQSLRHQAPRGKPSAMSADPR